MSSPERMRCPLRLVRSNEPLARCSSLVAGGDESGFVGVDHGLYAVAQAGVGRGAEDRGVLRAGRVRGEQFDLLGPVRLELARVDDARAAARLRALAVPSSTSATPICTSGSAGSSATILNRRGRRAAPACGGPRGPLRTSPMKAGEPHRPSGGAALRLVASRA
jgi:hypothetical protein